MKKGKVSIIYCLYDFTRTLRHMSMASLSNIRRFTDEPYELVLIDNAAHIDGVEIHHTLRDDYGALRLNDMKIQVNDNDHGYYKSLNEGARLATGDYLCFIQPDVFVHEGWLDGLTYYLDHDLADVVWPDQIPNTRQWIKESYERSHEDSMGIGAREAGCVIMTRKAYDKAGGWDERLFNEYGEAAMWARLDKAGARSMVTNKSLITHITAGTRYTMRDEHPDIHNEDMRKDGETWEKIRHGEL